MSGIISAVAGPDVDMAELEGAPLIVASVDLDLNLGPPAPHPDGLALGLDLGLGLGQEIPSAVHELSQVYRHNWPRFEPDISGLIPPGTLDIDPSFGSSDPLHQPSSSAFPSSTSGFRSLEQLGSFILQDMQTPESLEGQITLPHSVANDRFGRISRHPVGPPPPRLHFLDNEDFTPSLIPMDRRMDSDAPRVCLHNTPKESSPNCNAQANDDNVDENSPHANFDCNICLDLAKEPVVTTCGHLFCWPCLYQWLHVHSHHDECPVCKGYVPDDAIIPLYGRGNNKDTHKMWGEQHSGEIPSRPHARRVNSFQRRGSGVIDRERFFRGVDISRRDDRTEGQIDNGRQRGQLNSGVSRSAEQILHRLRIAQRLQREQLEQRIMARHRLLLTSSSIEPRTRIPVSVRDSQTQRTGGVEVQQRDHRERFLSQMTMNRFQRAERLAVIRARLVAGMDGLWESLQTSIPESGSSPPVHASTYTDVGRQEPVTSQYLQELAEPVVGGEESSTSASVFSDILNRNEQPDPLLSPLSQPRIRREAFEGGSSSADAEPGLMHTRKRRRLN